VRKVTSTTGRPASARVRASGTAAAASSISTTGTTASASTAVRTSDSSWAIRPLPSGDRLYYYIIMALKGSER
jgi:hypothetical protein